MNIGAAALQMPHDLGFSEQVIGLGAGLLIAVAREANRRARA